MDTPFKKSDWINILEHMRNSDIEPSSAIL